MVLKTPPVISHEAILHHFLDNLSRLMLRLLAFLFRCFFPAMYLPLPWLSEYWWYRNHWNEYWHHWIITSPDRYTVPSLFYSPVPSTQAWWNCYHPVTIVQRSRSRSWLPAWKSLMLMCDLHGKWNGIQISTPCCQNRGWLEKHIHP